MVAVPLRCVVDANVLLYLWVPGKYSERAIAVRRAFDHWYVPPLWRSEFANALAKLVRRGTVTFDQAAATMRTAEAALFDFEETVDHLEVLRLADASGCSAYDCEYVALADRLEMLLITEDKALLRQFPERAISMSDAV